MDGRRRALGRHIKRVRRAAGYRSQKAFAEAIGVHESSVANVERGDERVGEIVFDAIERGLKWPPGCMAAYLETGAVGILPGELTPAPTGPELRDDIERQLWAITDLTEDERWVYIDLHRARVQRRNETAPRQTG